VNTSQHLHSRYTSRYRRQTLIPPILFLFCICLFTDRVSIDYHLTLMHKLCVSSARTALVCHSFKRPPSTPCLVPLVLLSLSLAWVFDFVPFILPLFPGVITSFTMLALCTVSPSLVQSSHRLHCIPRQCLQKKKSSLIITGFGHNKGYRITLSPKLMLMLMCICW